MTQASARAPVPGRFPAMRTPGPWLLTVLLACSWGWGVHAKDSDQPTADAAMLIPPDGPLSVGVGVVVQAVLPELDPPFAFHAATEALETAGLRALDSVPFIDQHGGNSRMIRVELLPLEPGLLRLPPLEFRSGNRSLATPPVELVVTTPEQDERMVLDLQLSHREAFVGQPVLVSGLWSPGYDIEQIVAVDLQVPMTRRDDLVVDLAPEADFRQRGVIGLPLSDRRIPARLDAGVLEFSMVIRAFEPGEFVLEPARLLASVLDDPSPTRRTGFQYPAYFDNQFFRDPGDEPARRVFAISPELRLTVRPLPDGAPASFTGVVGAFKPEATVNPDELVAGGVTTLTVRLSGHPHPRALTDALPRIDDLPGFRSRFAFPGGPATGSVVDGEAVFRMALRPLSAEVDQVPPVVLSYFDPTEERYVEVSTESLALNVTGGSGGSVAVLSDGTRLNTPLLPVASGLGENTPWQALLAPPAWPERLLGGRGLALALLMAAPMLWYVLVWYRQQRFDLRPGARRRQIWRQLGRDLHAATAKPAAESMLDGLRSAVTAFLVRRLGLAPEIAADPGAVSEWTARHPSDHTPDLAETGRRLAAIWSRLDRHRYLSPDAADERAASELQSAARELRSLLKQLHQSPLPLP